MARHSENCSGEVDDAENGGLSPKKARRGRKKKMRSKRDEDDSGISDAVCKYHCDALCPDHII